MYVGNLSSGSTNIVLDIQTNGQIVVGDGSTSGTFNLVRFDADGTLDTTFGSRGIETGASVGGGLTMLRAPNGEAILIGTPTYGSGIILQEFGTLSAPQRLYVEQDADYNVTSITDINGNVVERYEYDPYGNVTVLNANGTVRGDGWLHSSFYAWNYTFQGGRDDTETGQIEFEHRDDNIPLGRWDQQDPKGTPNGPNRYQFEMSRSPVSVDPTGGVKVGLGGHFASATAVDPALAGPYLPGKGYQVFQDPVDPNIWYYTKSHTRVLQQGPITNNGDGTFTYAPPMKGNTKTAETPMACHRNGLYAAELGETCSRLEQLYWDRGPHGRDWRTCWWCNVSLGDRTVGLETNTGRHRNSCRCPG